MTTTSSPSDSGAAALADGEETLPTALTEPRPRIRGPLRKLLLSLIPANIAVFIIYGAVPQLLLPIQITGLDPANKVANLAIVVTVGGFAAMIAQPVAGAISDRTRSRFGRRAPWMVLGALVSGLALIGLSLSNTLVTIAIAYAIVQIAINFCQGPLTAVVPDRVPPRVYAIFAAFAGMALMIGAVGGQVVGAAFAKSFGAGYVTLAGVSLLLTVFFVLLNPDRSSKDDARIPFKLADFIQTFWVDPIKYPDFFWAFAGRLLLYTGYFSVLGYNLFLLSDYAGLGDQAPAYVAVLALIGLAGMVPSTILGGILSDRIGRRKPFVFASSVLVGLGLVIPIVSPTLMGLLLMSFVSGVGFGAFQAVDQALMNQVLPSSKSFAKDLGVVNIAATLPQVLAPAVGGGIVIALGYVGIFPVSILLSVAGACAVFFIKSVR